MAHRDYNLLCLRRFMVPERNSSDHEPRIDDIFGVCGIFLFDWAAQGIHVDLEPGFGGVQKRVLNGEKEDGEMIV